LSTYVIKKKKKKSILYVHIIT